MNGIFPPDLAGAGIERWDIGKFEPNSELSSSAPRMVEVGRRDRGVWGAA